MAAVIMRRKSAVQLESSHVENETYFAAVSYGVSKRIKYLELLELGVLLGR
jgi:hypothetical protein